MHFALTFKNEIGFINKFKKHIDFIILLCYNKKVETIKNFGGNKK